MKNRLMTISAALLIAASLFPSPARADKDDLLGLYSLAKAKDPFIGRAQARLDASKADTDIALAQMLPRVDASAGINWISHTTLEFGPTDVSGSFTGDSYGFSARLPIFQLPSVFNLAASKASVRGADAALSGIRQDLVIRLAEAYFGLLKARADEVLYQDELKRLSQIYEQVQAFKKAGTGDIIAVYEAKARMDSAAADMVKAGTLRRLASQQLDSIVGRQVVEVKDLGPYDPSGPEPPDVQWWLDTMRTRHPSLVQAREIAAQAGLQRKAVKAGHLPSIQVAGGYSVSKGSTFLPQVETRQWSIGLNLNLPIYSGGETEARTRRAVAVESEQGFVLSDTQEQNVQRLKQAFLSLEYSNAIITALKQKKASAEMQLTAVKKGRSIGTRTSIDLLNAEQGYAIAQRDLTSAMYDNALRRLQLKSAAGILDESDLTALNGMLVETPAPERFARSDELIATLGE